MAGTRLKSCASGEFHWPLSAGRPYQGSTRRQIRVDVVHTGRDQSQSRVSTQISVASDGRTYNKYFPILTIADMSYPASSEPPDVLAFLERLSSEDEISHISGNTSQIAKALPGRWLAVFHARRGFVFPVAERIKVTEVSVYDNIDEPGLLEARVVCEITVTKDMLASTGSLHESCAVFLIDECSTLPLSVLGYTLGGDIASSNGGVSQTINTVFHSTAPLGAKLRIVNTSMTMSREAMSCRGEIWDATNDRLVASGVQLKMHSSSAKL